MKRTQTPRRSSNGPIRIALSMAVMFLATAVTFGGTLPIVVSPATLPGGTVGVPYSQTLSATGGVSQVYSWTVSAGTLPQGLTLGPPTFGATVKLSGTPTKIGSFNFQITATDDANNQGSRGYTVVVSTGKCPLISISPSTLPRATTGMGYGQTLTAVGGQSPLTFSLGSGRLPTGLSLTSSGMIFGNPTASGRFSFDVVATDANGCTGSASYTIAVSMAACPQAPRVTGVVLNPTQIAPGDAFTLTWNPVGGYTGPYAVFASTDGGVNFSLFATTTDTAFTGTLTDTAAVSIVFEVEALANCIYPQRSTFVTLTVSTPPPPCLPPGAVSDITIRAASVTPTRAPAPTDFIEVAWSAPKTGTPPTSYSVRINGDAPVLSAGLSAVLPPRSTNLDPIQAFIRAETCSPEVAGPEVASDTVALFLTPPVASFTVSANPQAGQPIVLTDTSSPQATTWLWVFDDGSTDTRQAPTHTFTSPGSHDISLVASNGAGSSAVTESVVAAAAGSVRLAAASAVAIDASDPARRRARVEIPGPDAVWLRIQSPQAEETIVFLRFLDSAGGVVAERRLSVAPSQDAVYDLGAYGVRGAFSIELVSGQTYEPTISALRRPGTREVSR